MFISYNEISCGYVINLLLTTQRVSNKYSLFQIKMLQYKM